MRLPTTLLSLLALLPSSTLSALGPTPTVLLPTTYPHPTLLGRSSTTYNLTYFRKIPYAAPPTGANRWRAPQTYNGGVGNGGTGKTLDTEGDMGMCVQRTVNGTEDCLFLGVYSRPWKAGSALRPVLVVFHGGGFIQGSGGFSMPPSGYPVLNVSQANDFVVVYLNYRLNAWGFLPGKALKDDPTADLNVGLLDQQAALHWVHTYIPSFGGNPSNITIWGQSAGGGSVLAHLIANNSTTSPPLFQKALASSPYWPKTYRYDAPESEAIYTKFVTEVGCAGKGSGSATIACLRAVDVQKIRDAALVVGALYASTTSSFTWSPVIDGEFLSQPLTAAAKAGRLNGMDVWGMYNAEEGQSFITSALSKATGSPVNSTEAGFTAWLKAFLPGFSATQIAGVKTQYPLPGTAEAIGTYTTNYERAQLIYRDLVLACPGFWSASAAKGGGYVGEYDIAPAKHASDTGYWNRVNTLLTSQPTTYKGFAGAYASFMQTGDPNAHRVLPNGTSAMPVPVVRSGKQWLITQDTFTQVDASRLAERCAFWLGEGASVPV